MKLTYTNVNGYLIPNLTYKSGEQMEQLGKYGFLRRDYLKNHRNSTYQVMLLQDSIGGHLLEVDKAAREREEVLLKQLEEKEPLPDKEKELDGIEPEEMQMEAQEHMGIRRRRKEDWLGDMIQIMVYQELFRRRCDHRKCRRNFYF